MITLGKTHVLTVSKSASIGFYLDAEDLGEVLLPNRYAPGNLVVGDLIEVFLYLDSEDRPIATTETPKVEVGQFAYLQVVAVTGVGAFLDWGLSKDVLVPFAEQHRPMEEGRSYLVYLYIDKNDGRIVASSKVDKFLDDNKPHSFKAGEPVDLIIANSTDLGFKAIINHEHWGLLHASDVHQRLSFGQSAQGFVKSVRPDGKINLSLQAGQESRDKNCAVIEDYLVKQNGFTHLNDKSDPEEIKNELGMSKGAFKKAVGNLYKQKVIALENGGIRLLDEPPQSVDAEIAEIKDKPVKSDEQESFTQEPSTQESSTQDSSIQDLPIVELTREPVELYKILKFEGLVENGGEAKTVIAEGLVKVNDQVELQKRKKIMSGDTIEFGSEKFRVKLN